MILSRILTWLRSRLCTQCLASSPLSANIVDTEQPRPTSAPLPRSPSGEGLFGGVIAEEGRPPSGPTAADHQLSVRASEARPLRRGEQEKRPQALPGVRSKCSVQCRAVRLRSRTAGTGCGRRHTHPPELRGRSGEQCRIR